ncbi:HNH endonuclease signature motif containing protein [Brachybacterium alimentarium]|uniref:HNH endonuclease signature motif containing protein n=1 Tax=Brachybacterium alimentarium TaxID=47845 RepID=UPI000BB69FE6|nr:HNH endonuclease signature motif containing protein [Brachybacterium alimentarium]PCC31092.1 hypothetical protein CIK71_15470 [Brachybacterium alimentarium]
MGDELESDIPVWPVRARHELTEQRIVEAAEVGGDVDQATRVRGIHRTMRERTMLYAEQMRLLTEFFTRDPEVEGCLDVADVSAMKVAVGLRSSTHRAEALIRDAHRSVELMPRTFEALARGDLPEDFHQYLLRRVRRLEDDQVRDVDAHVAVWELASISRSQFERHVRLIVALVSAGTITSPREPERDVRLEHADPASGTATLSVSGPIPEITALMHRLDMSARDVQRAQRHALESGEEGPLPFDIDENLRERGSALSLATLRYAILTRSMLDIDPVQETATLHKILVTVPAMTLMGRENAPGLLNGTTPISADQARALAAGQNTWYRILTDPITGAYLPVTAETYQPTAQMRLQLRLRHPLCAAPGCTRPTVLAAEDDHLIEYDHEDPGSGGPTSLWNLHRLCWLHHKQKTAGQTDPTRDVEDTSCREPVETTWTIDGDVATRTRADHDLLTPIIAKTLAATWQSHERLHEEAVHLREEEQATPPADCVAQERRSIVRRFFLPPRTDPPPKRSETWDEPPPF